MDIKTRNKILYNVRSRQCYVCGVPSDCAVMDGCLEPACIDHAFMAYRYGYLVTFPKPKDVSVKNPAVRISPVK